MDNRSRSCTRSNYAMVITMLPKWTLVGNYHGQSVPSLVFTVAKVDFGTAITVHSTLFMDVYQPAIGGVIRLQESYVTGF